MDRFSTIAQSYSQAPWRRQLQLIGLFSLFLTLTALVAGIYLSVSAKAALAGRDIQNKQAEIETVDRDIEDSTSRLAAILATDAMEARAKKMGFEPIQTDQIVYMKIPGYTGRSNVVLAPESPPQIVGAEVTPPEYTESIFVWIRRELAANVYKLVGATQ
jgi:hypothetical protein